jgi:hypothetical protein
MSARRSRGGSAEPPAVPDAASGMSAAFNLAGAPPHRLVQALSAASQRNPTPRNPGEAAFDRWLNRELTRLYDDALSEPVPDELMRLIDGAAKK